ncbi:MAG TPA: H(+)-transporting ATPase [Polyangiaceae bacterium]|nr:H(+)-transporting ATPase [Polyangiaceae bacterium]
MSPFVESAAAAAHSPLLLAVTVDLDKSVFVQMVLFAVLVVVLKPLLFDPMLRVFALREEKTVGAKDEARSMQERAADILARYDGELKKARALAAEEREAHRKETVRLEAQILDEARLTAEGILANGRSRIITEIEVLQKGLAANTGSLGAALASQVLGREVKP